MCVCARARVYGTNFDGWFLKIHWNVGVRGGGGSVGRVLWWWLRDSGNAQEAASYSSHHINTLLTPMSLFPVFQGFVMCLFGGNSGSSNGQGRVLREQSSTPYMVGRNPQIPPTHITTGSVAACTSTACALILPRVTYCHTRSCIMCATRCCCCRVLPLHTEWCILMLHLRSLFSCSQEVRLPVLLRHVRGHHRGVHCAHDASGHASQLPVGKRVT